MQRSCRGSRLATCALQVCSEAVPAVPDLIECGLDCLESLQPEAMDVYKLKRDTAGTCAREQLSAAILDSHSDTAVQPGERFQSGGTVAPNENGTTKCTFQSIHYGSQPVVHDRLYSSSDKDSGRF